MRNPTIVYLLKMEYVSEIGMAIPRRISFLEESRSQGISILHSPGIKEDEIYSSGS
jgi:hypothetical protein